MNDEETPESCINDQIDDLRSEISRSAHAGMLHDIERHEKYNQALIETMKELVEDCGKSCITVLDIGTGTGILSMMAAKASNITSVTACEMFEPISELAKEIIKDNGLDHKIKVVNKASTDLKIREDLKEKADVLVTEILDSELIGEGVLPTIDDAHKRLLSPDARIIPAAADIHSQLIESTTLWKMHKFNPRLLNLKTPKEYGICRGTASCHELQISEFYPKHLKLLSQPHRMVQFDFERLTPRSRISSYKKTIRISNSGVIHGVVLWWDLILHKKKNISLSMAPSWVDKENDGMRWRDHWMQCVYYLPASIDVEEGEEMRVTFFHDDYSVWFDVKKVREVDGSTLNQSLTPPMCHCGLHFSWPREIFSLWNDESMVTQWQSFLREHLSDHSNVLVIGENSLLPVIVKKQYPSHDVSYMEFSEISKNIVKIIADENNLNIEMLNENKRFDTILIDPVWSSNILPWHFLKIWPFIGESNLEGAKMFPLKLHLKAAFVDLPDLWQVQAPVKEIVGFSLARFDSLMEEVRNPSACNAQYLNALPYSMVEYKNTIISYVARLATFDLTKDSPMTDSSYSQKLKLHKKVTNQTSLVVWLDFEFSDTYTFSTGLSTINEEWVRYNRQGVVFIPGTIKKGLINEELIQCTVVYRPKHEQEMLFAFSS